MKQLFFLPLISAITFLGCPTDKPCTTCPTPLDTTSHAFTWQTFTWGGGGSSSINDIAIINEDNDVWAVGDINLPDSVAQDTLGFNFPFGAAHWNGGEWQLLRIPTNIGLTYTSYPRLTGIIAFSSTDIWLASGGGVHRFNGNVITNSYWLAKFPGNTGILNEGQSVEKLWGTSSSSLYAVGRNGAIAYFNGFNWQKLESGTDLNIYDIYGSGSEILAIASSYTPSRQERKLLQINPVTKAVTSVSDSGLALDLESVWFVPSQHYYVVGDGIYEKGKLTENIWTAHLLDITPYYTTRVRGNASNDVFIVGAFGECLHWNASSWYSYRNVTGLADGVFGGLAVKENTVVIGGQTGQDAIVMIGKR